MNQIPGYDQWKLDYPPHYDQGEVELCIECNEHEVELEEDQLCADCYYEKNHGELIEYLEDAVRYVNKHFDNGKPKDLSQAKCLINFATQKLNEIGGKQDA